MFFLAVGHGVEPSGIFDPGAIGTDGRMEHMEAFQVCTFALAAMRRSGLSVVSETAQGASHDPDFVGSAHRANELNPRVAIEVHFDSATVGAPGYSGLYFSDQGKQLAAKIGAAFVARNLPRVADVERPGLFFLNSTNMTALIPEINKVHDFPVEVNRAQGEALAEGVCAFLGQPFKPPAGGPDEIDHPHPHPHPQPHGNGQVTENSKLLAAPRAPASQVREFLLGKSHGGYTDDDVETIVDSYYATATAVGLDPLLVVAQMSEETGHLTSFWSQRPRRNFAGIGVTGEEGQGQQVPQPDRGDPRAHRPAAGLRAARRGREPGPGRADHRGSAGPGPASGPPGHRAHAGRPVGQVGDGQGVRSQGGRGREPDPHHLSLGSGPRGSPASSRSIVQRTGSASRPPSASLRQP